MAYYPLKVKDGSGNVHTVGDPRTQDKADKASPALTGTPTAPTAAADTDSTQIATTAFVVGQASAVSPQMDSSAAAGTSKRFARADHVHPSDTSRAPLASPAFTGTPTAPTASAGTNTTQVATTEFVSTAVANVIDGAPGVLDTLNELAQALGDDPNYVTSITSALALKAPLASPTLTGTPAAPTAAADTETTQIATTAFVIGQAASTAPADNGTAAVGTSKKFARADHVHKASASVVMSTSEPSSPTDGMVWVDSDSDVTTFDPDTLIAKSLINAAGDLLVGSADDTVGRLALGNNGEVLTVDTAGSGVAKVKWAAAASGAAVDPLFLAGV